MSSMSPIAEVGVPDIAIAPTPPRRWPALALVGLGFALYYAPKAWEAAPETIPAMPTFMASMWGPLLCTLLLGIWWLFLSSASWPTRLTTLGLAILLGGGSLLAADPSARMFIMSKGIPAAAGLVALLLCFAWSLRPIPRMAMALALAVLALLPWQFAQFNGVTGQFGMDPKWRWHPDPGAGLREFHSDFTLGI